MNKKIMIIEDEKGFQDIYEVMFEDRNYDITYASDGDVAMKLLDEYKPDLIILDMLLDMVTGDTFFLHLKGIPEFEDIPVIIISAHSQKYYESLVKIDPDIVYIEKVYLTREKLFEEVERKLSD